MIQNHPQIWPNVLWLSSFPLPCCCPTGPLPRQTGKLPITSSREGSDEISYVRQRQQATWYFLCNNGWAEYWIRNFLHNIMLCWRKADWMSPCLYQQGEDEKHMERQPVSVSATYNSQHATSESAQRKHGLPVANPKVYFSVINGWIRNSAQRAMQLLQSSYSGMINQSSCNTYWTIWQTNNIFQSFTRIPHKYSERLISVTRRSVPAISWINVSLIWTSSAPGFSVLYAWCTDSTHGLLNRDWCI